MAKNVQYVKVKHSGHVSHRRSCIPGCLFIVLTGVSVVASIAYLLVSLFV